MSRTQDALKWLDDNPDTTVYAAAKAFGLTATTLYKARKQLAETKDRRCPCCGQLLPEGQAIPNVPSELKVKGAVKAVAASKSTPPATKKPVAPKARAAAR